MSTAFKNKNNLHVLIVLGDYSNDIVYKKHKHFGMILSGKKTKKSFIKYINNYTTFKIQYFLFKIMNHVLIGLDGEFYILK